MHPHYPPDKTLFLLDGHYMIFKAYFGLGNARLRSRSGQPTGAVFGFLRMLLKILKDFEAHYLCVAFDGKEKTFRHEILADYKGTREAPPEDLIAQIPMIQDLLDVMSIPRLTVEGFEADDIIGTLAVRAEKEGMQAAILSTDKDLAQLVNEQIHLLNIRKSLDDIEILDPVGVKEKYGVRPDQIRDFLSLTGDTSDNVPGIPGVGPKTAAKLLQKYNTIEGLYENISQLKPGKTTDSIGEHRTTVDLARVLVTLNTEVPIESAVNSLAPGKRDNTRLRQLLEELEFKSVIQELRLHDVPPPAPATAQGILDFSEAAAAPASRKDTVITTENALMDLSKRVLAAKRLAVDTETTSTDVLVAELVGISLSLKEGEAFYIPVGHKGAKDQLPLGTVLNVVSQWFESRDRLWVGHNLKYDWGIFRTAGLLPPENIFDTMVASFLLDPSRRRHNIDDLAEYFLHLKKIPTSSLIGGKGLPDTMDLVPVDLLAPYACEDAETALRLAALFEPQLKEQQLDTLFYDLEMPLIPVLEDIERAGVKVDVGALDSLDKEVSAQIARLEEETYALAGGPFNLRSPKQLNDLFFEKLGYSSKGLKKTVHGYTTDEDALSQIAAVDPERAELPKKLLEHRSLSKLKSTYIDGLRAYVYKKTGRIHTSLNQTISETGRLSSTEPNLQNIPIREGAGQDFRKVMVAEPGNVLLSADYSQVELRILASVASEEAMQQAFADGRDIHQETASRLFGVPREGVTADMRRRAKVVNFGIDYGMTEYGMSQRLGIPVKEAKAFIDRYFKTFPKIKDYIERTIEETKARGYAVTLGGRRRYFPEIASRNFNLREAAKRQAINLPIQGTAAEIIKKAMILLHKALLDGGYKARMILQIHDELLLEMPESEARKVADLTRKIMEGAAHLDVPLEVNVATGKNWYEAH